MTNKSFDKVKPYLLLAIFLLLWRVIPAGVKLFVDNSFYEFQAPVLNLGNHLDDIKKYWALRKSNNPDEIKKGIENSRISASFEVIEHQLKEHEDLLEKIAQLEKQLKLPPSKTHRYEHARVVHRDINAWWQRITIRKGRDYNIPENAAVIFEGGVVGKTKIVNKSSTIIELITSPNFRMAAKFKGDPRPVTFRGSINTGFTDPRGNVKDVPSDILATMTSPQFLVSSELGSIFPEDLPIGYVRGLEPGSNGLFKTGTVELDKRLLYLKEVSILIPIEK